MAHQVVREPNNSSVSLSQRQATVVDEKRDLDRRLSQVRARMVVRLEEVTRRIEKTKDAMNIAQMIRNHPLAAAGMALAAGAIAGLPRDGKRALGTLITGFALQVMKLRLDAWLAPKR